MTRKRKLKVADKKAAKAERVAARAASQASPGVVWHSGLLYGVPEHMKRIGVLIAEWAHVEYLRFELFAKLSELPLDKADAIFFGVRSDRTRQEIVNSLLVACVSNREDRKPLNEIHVRLGALSKRRAAFAHSLVLPSAAGGAEPTAKGEIAYMHPRQTPEIDEQLVSIPMLDQLISDIIAVHIDYKNAISELRIPRRPSPDKSQ